MKGETERLIRTVAMINVILGVWTLVRDYRWITGGNILEWFFMLGGGRGGGFPAIERLLIFALSVLVTPVLPVAKVVAGSGLLFIRRWAYRLTLLVMLVDFAIKFSGSVNYAVYCCLFVSQPTVWISQGLNAVWVRMLPVYIIALFDLLVIAILCRGTIRNRFGIGPGEAVAGK